MAHDVFISYSSRDKATADAVCHAIEADGIRCWIAPRDIHVGRTWKQSIVPAIRDSRMMVLIFSGEANNSPQVRREVDIAFESDVPILPFRIEDVEMSDDLYYCIASRHWLDALTDPRDDQIQELVLSVRALAQVDGDPDLVEPAPRERAPEVVEQVAPVAQPSPSPTADAGGLARRLRSRTGKRIAIGAVGVAAILAVRAIWSGPSTAELAERGIAAYEAEDYAAALPLLLQAADKGASRAQNALGRMYLYGWGVTRDRERALQLFRASADQGDPAGQTGLGVIYSTGEVVDLDDEEAVRWYRLAAEQGYSRAQTNLGFMYLAGRGVAADTAEALRLYRSAADGGDAQGQFNLGYMYQYGLGVEVDLEESSRLYRLAAEQGHAASQLNLGYLYGRGEGVPRSYSEQLKWYELAAAQGDTIAEKNLEILRNMAWAADGLVPGAWTTLAGTERGAELELFGSEAISGRLEEGGWDIERVRTLPLSFYEDAALYEVELRREEERGMFSYVRTGSGSGSTLRPLNGESAVIHQLNADAPLRIGSIHQAVDYVRFFIGAIEGDKGRFQVVEELDDLLWIDPREGAAGPELVSGKLRLLDLTEDPEGGWRGSGTVLYATGVYEADFEVDEAGLVTMLNDTPVARDLPVFVESFDDAGVRTRTVLSEEEGSG